MNDICMYYMYIYICVYYIDMIDLKSQDLFWWTSSRSRSKVSPVEHWEFGPPHHPENQCTLGTYSITSPVTKPVPAGESAEDCGGMPICGQNWNTWPKMINFFLVSDVEDLCSFAFSKFQHCIHIQSSACLHSRSFSRSSSRSELTTPGGAQCDQRLCCHSCSSQWWAGSPAQQLSRSYRKLPDPDERAI